MTGLHRVSERPNPTKTRYLSGGRLTRSTERFGEAFRRFRTVGVIGGVGSV